MERTAAPRLVVLGRLVPHKRVEHAIEVVARLRARWPGLRLSVVGEGWWDAELRAHAERLGVHDVVDFHGWLDEPAKHAELARGWVHLCPSVKEGWGLVVTEAGAHAVPTVGYRSAGGLRESVLDGRTGLLVDDLDELVEATDRLLRDEELRTDLGAAAARHATAFSWPASVRRFAGVLAAAARGSAPVAVLEDVDRRLVALLERAAVGVERGLDADHGDHAEGGAPAEGDEHGDERLHSGFRFSQGLRRSETVEPVAMIHNTAPPTVPSAPA